MPSIVGTWKLVRASAHAAAGNPLSFPDGPNPMGRLIFSADGRMMSVVCDGPRDLPGGSERAYSSYCGNYTFAGERLVTRVDAASDPSRIGGDQVRGVRFDSEHMILLPPPRGTGAAAE
jgi:Lipocalin-like domain